MYMWCKCMDILAFIRILSHVKKWEKSSLSNCFVVFGHMHAIDGGVNAIGEEVERCIYFLKWAKVVEG